jgi:acetyl esterase
MGTTAWSETVDVSLVPLARAYPRLDLADLQRARGIVTMMTSVAARSAHWKSAAEGVVVRDVAFTGGRSGAALPARIYEPEDGPTHGGVVLFFHGGAFVMGNLDSEHRRCLRWCRTLSCAVVSVDYRLAPEQPFPAALLDAMDAYEAVERCDQGIACDEGHIVVAGTSAGGALAAGLATLRRDLGLSTPAGQVLIYPVLDDRLATASMTSFVDTPGWDSVSSTWMWRYYLPEPAPVAVCASSFPALFYAAPGRVEDLAGLPPSCVITAGLDPLRDEGIDYAQRLMGAGVPTELHNFGRAFHGFDAVGGTPLAEAAIDLQVSMLRGLLP